MDSDIRLRSPNATDGMSVHQLIDRCQPLDPNSSYCNLLQCTHFSDTCVIASSANDEQDVYGFISGYIKPAAPDTLFVWQVAVDSRARGQGLASKMLDAILSRPALNEVRFIETTITADNDASQRLFQAFARRYQTEHEVNEFFDRQRHFKDQHDSELLHRIGPIAQPAQ